MEEDSGMIFLDDPIPHDMSYKDHGHRPNGQNINIPLPKPEHQNGDFELVVPPAPPSTSSESLISASEAKPGALGRATTLHHGDLVHLKVVLERERDVQSVTVAPATTPDHCYGDRPDESGESSGTSKIPCEADAGDGKMVGITSTSKISTISEDEGAGGGAKGDRRCANTSKITLPIEGIISKISNIPTMPNKNGEEAKGDWYCENTSKIPLNSDPIEGIITSKIAKIPTVSKENGGVDTSNAASNPKISTVSKENGGVDASNAASNPDPIEGISSLVSSPKVQGSPKPKRRMRIGTAAGSRDIPPPQTPPIDPTDGWDCTICTYNNSRRSFTCQICGTRKGTSTRKPRLSSNIIAQQALVEKSVLSHNPTTHLPPPALIPQCHHGNKVDSSPLKRLNIQLTMSPTDDAMIDHPPASSIIPTLKRTRPLNLSLTTPSEPVVKKRRGRASLPPSGIRDGGTKKGVTIPTHTLSPTPVVTARKDRKNSKPSKIATVGAATPPAPYKGPELTVFQPSSNVGIIAPFAIDNAQAAALKTRQSSTHPNPTDTATDSPSHERRTSTPTPSFLAALMMSSVATNKGLDSSHSIPDDNSLRNGKVSDGSCSLPNNRSTITVTAITNPFFSPSSSVAYLNFLHSWKDHHHGDKGGATGVEEIYRQRAIEGYPPYDKGVSDGGSGSRLNRNCRNGGSVIHKVTSSGLIVSSDHHHTPSGTSEPNRSPSESSRDTNALETITPPLVHFDYLNQFKTFGEDGTGPALVGVAKPMPHPQLPLWAGTLPSPCGTASLSSCSLIDSEDEMYINQVRKDLNQFWRIDKNAYSDDLRNSLPASQGDHEWLPNAATTVSHTVANSSNISGARCRKKRWLDRIKKTDQEAIDKGHVLHDPPVCDVIESGPKSRDSACDIDAPWPIYDDPEARPHHPSLQHTPLKLETVDLENGIFKQDLAKDLRLSPALVTGAGLAAERDEIKKEFINAPSRSPSQDLAISDRIDQHSGTSNVSSSPNTDQPSKEAFRKNGVIKSCTNTKKKTGLKSRSDPPQHPNSLIKKSSHYGPPLEPNTSQDPKDFTFDSSSAQTHQVTVNGLTIYITDYPLITSS